MNGELAVICASPPGINPGMDSVDLAFSYLADKYKLNTPVKFWRLYTAGNSAGSDEQKAIPYSIIPADKDFYQSKGAVLYWGDFLHMRQYHEAVTRKLVSLGLYDTQESAMLRVQEVFLQSNQDMDVLQRTLTFGSTLLFNTIQDEEYGGYREPLERFLKLCKAAWFRDVYSALKACQIRESFDISHLGVDCANLLNPIALPVTDNLPVDNVVGVFIGRSTKDIKGMISFASDFAKALACRPAWLKWGDTGAFPSLSSIFKEKAIRALDSFSYEPARHAEQAVSGLLKYRAIVTDTYHILVNAWNLGVPAICLAENEYDQARNVNYGTYFARRDKRQIFMTMYNALDFFVPMAEVENRGLKTARVSYLANMVVSRKAIDSIQLRIRAHAEAAEFMLMQELSNVL